MVSATRFLAATTRAQLSILETRCQAISSKSFLQTSILSSQPSRSLPAGSRSFSNGKSVVRQLSKPLLNTIAQQSNTIAQQSRSNARSYSSHFGYDPPSFRERVRAFRSNLWVRRAPWIALSGYIIYLAFHIERVPDVDGRWRLMIIPNNSELVERYRYDGDFIESIQDQQLEPGHIKVQRARRVLNQLVLANEIGTVEGGMDWDVSVFTMNASDDSELDILNQEDASMQVGNHFIIASSDIDLCSSDEELAFLLAFRLARNQLSHSREEISTVATLPLQGLLFFLLNWKWWIIAQPACFLALNYFWEHPSADSRIREADRRAMELMDKAGFRLDGAISIVRKGERELLKAILKRERQLGAKSQMASYEDWEVLQAYDRSQPASERINVMKTLKADIEARKGLNVDGSGFS